MSPEIESYIYAQSIIQAETIDGYVKMHIKEKSKWLPNFIYQFLLKKLLVMNNFIVLKKKSNMKTNKECKRCGLLKSTIEATNHKCIPDRRMGTELEGVHEYTNCNCKVKYCIHYESDFENFIKTNN